MGNKLTAEEQRSKDIYDMERKQVKYYARMAGLAREAGNIDAYLGYEEKGLQYAAALWPFRKWYKRRTGKELGAKTNIQVAVNDGQ